MVGGVSALDKMFRKTSLDCDISAAREKRGRERETKSTMGTGHRRDLQRKGRPLAHCKGSQRLHKTEKGINPSCTQPPSDCPGGCSFHQGITKGPVTGTSTAEELCGACHL